MVLSENVDGPRDSKDVLAMHCARCVTNNKYTTSCNSMLAHPSGQYRALHYHNAKLKTIMKDEYDM